MARRVLCVAEKPSIAKAVSQHLSGGQVNTVSWDEFCIDEIGLMNTSGASLAILTSRITISILILAHHGAAHWSP